MNPVYDPAPRIEGRVEGKKRVLAKRLAGAAWGVLLVWVGITFFLNIGFGWTVLVIGLIMLAAQGARKVAELEIEGFWIAVGALFVLGGGWEIAELSAPVVPVLAVLGGLVLIIASLLSRGKLANRGAT